MTAMTTGIMITPQLLVADDQFYQHDGASFVT